MSDHAILAHPPDALAVADDLLALAAELAEDECLSETEALSQALDLIPVLTSFAIRYDFDVAAAGNPDAMSLAEVVEC